MIKRYLQNTWDRSSQVSHIKLIQYNNFYKHMDTIHLKLDSTYSTPELYNHLKEILTNTFYSNGRYGETYSGMLRNVTVMMNERWVKVHLSIPKYFKGNNQITLTLEEIKKAIEQLSEELKLPLINAIVTRLDYSGNIICTSSVDQFLRICGQLRGYRRLEQSSGLYYAQSERYIAFYDKVKEVGGKNKLIEPFKNKNVIRYELRWKSQRVLAKDLNLTVVTVKDLYDNYDVLIQKWVSTFFMIVKEHDSITFNSEAFKCAGSFDKQILIQGVKSIGGLPVILNAIKVANDRGDFGYGNKSTNLKRKYTDLMTHPELTEKNNVAKEIEDKVKAVGFVMGCPQVVEQLIRG